MTLTFGEVIAKRDQNGTIHEYMHDDFGRLLHDRITTLASGVNGTVRSLGISLSAIADATARRAVAYHQNFTSRPIKDCFFTV